MFTSKDKMARNGRVCRGNLTDFLLLGVFVTLAYVFMHRKNYMSKVDSALIENNMHASRELQAHEESARQSNGHLPREPTGNTGTLRDPLKIDDRIKRIQDVRSAECRSLSYSSESVSIIITFFDYQFYDLKTTIDSVRLHTPDNLIKEIIMVDEGSTLDYIKDDARVYARKLAKAKLIRLEQREGPGKARWKGVYESTASHLVFLDTNTIVTPGWLEPLIDLVLRDETIIAVPHFDNVRDPVSYEYGTTAISLITVFTWSLTMRMYRNPEVRVTTEPIESPVLRGNAFVISKQLFVGLGGYDEEMRDFAAENLEFSFRAWMCGGKIKIVPCSRVGVLNLFHPVKVTRSTDIRHITEVWLDFKQDFVYKSTQTNRNDKSQYEDQKIQAAKSRMQGKQCKSFPWYLQNVGRDIYSPSSDAVHYGLLKGRTGRCARAGDDSRMDLGSCNPDKYNLQTSDLIFEYTDSKLLRIKKKCVVARQSAYVVVDECNKSDNKHLWDYDPVRGELTNVWSGYCAMHVTDPDKKIVEKGRQILMVQDCKLDKDGSFVKWDFIIP